MDPIIIEMRELAKNDFSQIPKNEHSEALIKVKRDLRAQRVLYLLAAASLAAVASLMFYLYTSAQTAVSYVSLMLNLTNGFIIPIFIILLSVLAVWFLQAAGGASYNKWLKTLLLESTRKD